MANKWGNNGNSDRLHFLEFQDHCRWWLQAIHEIKRLLLLERKTVTNLDRIFKNRDITLLTKVHIVKAIVSPVVMYRWELYYKEGWTLKNWCLWTVVLEKTLESPLDCKEVKSVNPKGNQPRISTGRTDAVVEAPVLWPLDTKSWLTRKDPDAGKDWRREKKGTTEDEMVGWYHWLNGHDFEQAPGFGEWQGSVACCIPWGCKESDMTEQLKDNNKGMKEGASLQRLLLLSC